MADGKKISDTFLSLLDSVQSNKSAPSGKKLCGGLNTESSTQKDKQSKKHQKKQTFDERSLQDKGFAEENNGGCKTNVHSRTRKQGHQNLNNNERFQTSSTQKWKPQGNSTHFSKQDLVEFPSQNQLLDGNKCNLFNENPKSLGRFPAKNNETQSRVMGYKYLESLLDKESLFLVTKLACPMSGFHELVNNRPLRPDLLILIVRALSVVNESDVHQLKIQILSDTFKSEFIDEIKNYVGLICIENDLKRLKSVETFYRNILALFESIINFFPSLMNEKFKSTLNALSLSMRNARSEQKIEISDFCFEQLKGITDQVNSYIENNKMNENRSKQSSNTFKEIQAQNNYRDLAIVPTMEDFMNKKTFLRHNKVKGAFTDCESYLDTQFRLLREDFVAPLRSGIFEYIESLNAHLKRKYSNVRIYPKVQFVEPRTNGDTLGFLVCFDCDSKLPRNMNWDYSKRFMIGSLLLFSDNHFQTFYLATVAGRDTKDLQRGVVFVSFLPGIDTPANLFEAGTFFVMAESEVYYEAYRHVLTALKRLNQNNFPMKEYIVDVNIIPSPPQYVLDKLVYVLSTTCSDNFEVSLLEEDKWPTPEELNMNFSQHQAFKSALTNKFVVVQGPPGTGKTFLALKIVEALLKNHASKDSPIVVICYTNHALDQFLEGVLKYTQNLIRIGSRSQNEALTKFNLKEIRNTKKCNRTFSSSHLFRKTIREKIEIQESLEKISIKIIELSNYNGILDLNVLKSVITSQHFECLVGQEVEWLTFRDISYQIGEGNEIISDNTPLVSIEPEVPQPDIFEDIAEYHNYEEQMDFDENVQRLADILEDDYVDDGFDLIEGSYFISKVEYKILLQGLSMDIYELKQQILNCDLTVPLHVYFEQDANFKINELQLCLDLLTTQFSKFKDFKFDHKKFEILHRSPNVWEIHPHDRWVLYITWIHLYCCQLKQTIHHLSKRYQDILEKLSELRQMEDLSIVQDADVIGLTTSAAAKLRVLLESLEPKIVIVEEAAEVLEAHIVTSLTKSVQHLILIGDHKQLKPNPAVYELAKKYHMDVSLFERMLNNGLGCSVLDTQHRMRPEIASLITPCIYPSLFNHPSTLERKNISGVDKFVFFLTHDFPEDQLQETSSKQNRFEADFLMKLCLYLVYQGYKPAEITVLSTYAGQVWLMRKEKKRLSAESTDWRDLRITPVDNYQGEENRIILLSLVRSNKEAKIGFLSAENRVCVALSRARDGLYIVGNMDNLTASSSIWPKIKERLEEINAVGRHLVLRCERHPHQVTPVSSAKDFSAVPYGGCSLKCEFELTCGHICPQVCHIIDRDHGFFKCKQPCERPPCEEENHKCPLLCYQTCKPCAVPVKKQLLCEHWMKLPCHQEPATAKCLELVPATMVDCDHTVQKLCYKDINSLQCNHPCPNRLPCGHTCEKFCHVKTDPDHIEYKCKKKCPKRNVKCRMNHPCSKMCYEDCGNCSVKILVKLACGHSEKIECSIDESSVKCTKPCTKLLKCGHKCPLQCWLPCDSAKCKIKVDKEGTCGHILKNILCSESTDDEKCYNQCTKTLVCGHPCKAKCFQYCSKELCQELVESQVAPACEHPPFKVLCNINKPGLNSGSDELVQMCLAPCQKMMACGHVCSSTCGRCMTGRLHAPCREKCNKRLICGHWCKFPCSVLCPPCQSNDCFQICTHSKCKKNHPCNTSCQSCTRSCVWECDHYKCSKQCGEECNRPVCDEPCQYVLKCGHLCIGYCGENHPLLCRVCDYDNINISTSPGARFVLLDDCNHVTESSVLDDLVDEAIDNGVERLLECPECSKPIVKTLRYRSVYIRFRKQLVEINKTVNEEMFRIRELSSALSLSSEPTVSPAMNKLLFDCCSQDYKNVKATMAKVILLCLLEPIVKVCSEFATNSRLMGLSTHQATVEQELRLKLRLEYLANLLRPRLFQISYEDIVQVELEVVRVWQALKGIPSHTNRWFDINKYTWKERKYGLTLKIFYHERLAKFSSTLKTRHFEKLWHQCPYKHLYVCELQEMCVTCYFEEQKEMKRIEQLDQDYRNPPPLAGNLLVTDYRVRGKKRGRGKRRGGRY